MSLCNFPFMLPFLPSIPLPPIPALPIPDLTFNIALPSFFCPLD